MLAKLILRSVMAGLALCAMSLYAGDADATFSLPGSVLLFGTYDELFSAVPGRIKIIKPPMEITANHGYFAYPSISPRGDLIAWAFATEIHEEAEGYRAQFALGVYSLANQGWKIYAELDGIKSIEATSFSPEGLRVAFVNEKDDKRELLILDLASGAMRNTPHPSIWYRTSLSWSPASKSIVMIINQASKDNPLVAVLNLETGGVQPLGEGIGATWSPNGEWIAYYDASGEKCLMVHPDGTGAKVVANLHQSAFSSRHFGWGGPVWSPDSKQLLMSEMKGDLLTLDVVLVDVESGRIRTKKRAGLPIFGWASQ